VAELVSVRVDWDRTALPFTIASFYVIHIGPEPAYPFGRKGLALAGAWRQLSGRKTDGMLILDGDVAVDLLDLARMRSAIHMEPGAVHTAPVRLWPASTGQRSWVWGHWDKEMSQDECAAPRRFSFGLTYLPQRLIGSCIRAGLEEWSFPHVDRLVAAQAVKDHVPVRVVNGCSPKHCHF
jgi:hypothetical protein